MSIDDQIDAAYYDRRGYTAADAMARQRGKNLDGSDRRETLPADPKVRKAMPIATGVLDYFPDAIAAVAECSRVGNDQHNPGQPLHWAKEKSTDHADCIARHLIDRGKRDGDGVRHSAKVAWRALALLQTEIEKEAKDDPFYNPRTGRRAGDSG